jgi:type I restriction-modification system DNA methylase subunit
MKNMTEDQVRDYANSILNFYDTETARAGVGQTTTFNQLGFKGVSDRPDGWYLPNITSFPAIILETKSTDVELKEKQIEELLKNCKIVKTKYKNTLGILYNGVSVRVYMNGEEIEQQTELHNKEYYLSLFAENTIDKNKIYCLTKKINDCLHFVFGVKNLYHRMVFTACALVAKRYGAVMNKGINFTTFHAAIHSTLSKSFEGQIEQNNKLSILLEVYKEIKLNNKENQEAIDNFIGWVEEISDHINSDYWNGEDVMAIFFNEFTRYKGKSERGQVFTPDHITSLMYRLLEVDKNSIVFDGACGSGAFLVKSMCNMIKEAGGISTMTATTIKQERIYGIESDREIYALACANMLIHKDGITNLKHMDTRSEEAGRWIKSKRITKVLMNPPFENKYGCLDIVENVLDNVAKDEKDDKKIRNIECAFILPDNKLEKNIGKAKRIISKHRLTKIIKLPENVFKGITTSIFIFKSGVPQGNSNIFACYIEDDGFETVKNQGRHDVKNTWQKNEERWFDIIHKQNGSDTIQWLDPKKNLSYILPKGELEIYAGDFRKVVFDYMLFTKGIDAQDFKERIVNELLYSEHCEFSSIEKGIKKRIGEYRENSRELQEEKIDTSKWKPFIIGTLFAAPPISKPCKRAFQNYSEGEVAFVASGNSNNGVAGYVKPQNKEGLDEGNCITVSAVDGSTFYQKSDFLGRGGGGSSISIIRHDKLNECRGLFLATVIGKACAKYSFANMCSQMALKKETIYLPATNEEPDWVFMEEYIRGMPYADEI